MFRIGYNTNGLAHHRLTDAVDFLADLGYDGLALTPDVGHLDPFHSSKEERQAFRTQAEARGLALTIETGARFVMDATRKHFPTLLEDAQSDRDKRLDFLERCVELAAELGAPVVSFWAGTVHAADKTPLAGDPDAEGRAPDDAERYWDRLCAGTEELLRRSQGSGVRLAFEPEPGMFVERPSGYDELCQRLGQLDLAQRPLGLCLDVGHLLCTGDLPVGKIVREYASCLAQVHLDDIRDGEHIHRPFGEGDLDLVDTLSALQEVGYGGMAAVELSRDSHRAALAAKSALAQIRAALRR